MPPYHDYFANYIRLTHGSTVADALEHSTNTCLGVLNGISEDEGDFRYADGKWTIKELLCHVIDTERIMAYRALCFARKEQAALPGYDENAYVVNSFANDRTVGELVEEFEVLRKSTTLMFDSFNPQVYDYFGNANGLEIDVRSIGMVIAGHAIHHINILQERYLASS